MGQRYFEVSGPSHWSTCHRSPPTVIVLRDGLTSPQTLQNHIQAVTFLLNKYCMEFRAAHESFCDSSHYASARHFFTRHPHTLGPARMRWSQEETSVSLLLPGIMSAARDFLLSVLPPKRVEKFDGEGNRIPAVTLTFAQSIDGKIAGTKGKQFILSGAESMLMTHWMRAMHDAIVVGVGTALNDDPQLNIRLIPEADRAHVTSPRPVILDAHLHLRSDCKLLRNYRDGKGQQPWVFCASDTRSGSPERNERRSALEAAGAMVYEVPCVSGFLSITNLLRTLYEHDIRSVMVEGGAGVINTFMNQASQPRGPEQSPIVDTLIITVAPKIVGDDGLGYSVGFSADMSDHRTAFPGTSSDSSNQIPTFTHVKTVLMGKDSIIAGRFM